ncbi:MAG TPA: hypothetical protein VJ964_07245 [Balneolaceae bacterium]|nr:hypothetical protein [Balneolaceae bacterium]
MTHLATYFLAKAKNCQCFRVCSLTLLLTLAISFYGNAQTIAGDIRIEHGSQLWIEGSAGLIHYKCEAEKIDGTGEIENTENPQSTVRGHGKVNLSVSLPVHSLDCGKRAMNSDMYNALKAKQFPSIHYKLLDVKLAKHQSADTLARWMDIRTLGVMEIAGVRDTTTIFVKGKVLGDSQFHVKGSKSLNMDTFDIKPPSAMFGLIRANKELVVHFDVTVTLGDVAK